MTSILSLMFSALLALAGLHAGNIRGVRQWAVANFSLCLGFGFAYYYRTAAAGYEWAVFVAAMLVSAGIALELAGINAFKEKRGDWRRPALFVALVAGWSLWFAVLHPNLRVRAVGNSLIVALGYAACARALLIPVEPRLRLPFWFTGAAFAVLSAMLLLRGVAVGTASSGAFGLYSRVPINSASFFVVSLVQLCVTFGFVLMLNYRLILDIERTASRDVLTGALNRRCLEEEAARLKARCERTGESLAMMMIDVDRFKSINDLHGHPGGDHVLRRLAGIVRDSIRADDYFGRYGGEEFCVLLPSTTEREAYRLAERLRQTYAATVIDLDGGRLYSTVSIGVADSAAAGADFAALVAAADRALYQAKRDGRNRTAIHSDMAVPAIAQ